MEPPYVVKPVREGSSFGVVIVKEGQAHPPQIISSAEWNYGAEVLVEKYIAGRELTCAVIGDRAMDVCEIIPVGHQFYDYDSKYVAGASTHVCPAKILPNIYQKYKQWPLRRIGQSGVGA